MSNTVKLTNFTHRPINYTFYFVCEVVDGLGGGGIDLGYIAPWIRAPKYLNISKT